MNTGLTLDAIESIVMVMRDQQGTERLNSYATVKVLTDELMEYARSHDLPHGYIHEKIIDLLQGCKYIAHLESREGVDAEEWGIRDALGAMKALRSRLSEGVTSSSMTVNLSLKCDCRGVSIQTTSGRGAISR